MKAYYHKIISLLMAFVVLFSTTSFTVDMHFCGNMLVETAIMHKANGCNMQAQSATTNSCETIVKNCCSDKLLVVDGQDELKLNIEDISLKDQLFITSFVIAYLQSFESYSFQKLTYTDYRPPLVIRPLYKLDETYLI